MAKVERYGPGEEARDLAAGDFILAHRHHVMAAMISLAQKRRFRGPDAMYAHWSHAAVVDDDGSVIEAEMQGIVRSPISKYRADEYHLVRLTAELDRGSRASVAAFARGRIGQPFGYLDMAGASIYLITGLPVRMVRRHHEICSSLVVRSLQSGGLLRELDPSLTLPGDLAKRFDVRPS